MDADTSTDRRTAGPVPAVGPSVHRWVLLCAAAEAVGMSAAAGAATVASGLAGSGDGSPAAAWGVVVLGGLVEGVAVGLAQATALRPTVPGLHRVRWVLSTVVVAGLGWAVVSGNAMFADDDVAGATPPWPVVLAAAAGLGLAMVPSWERRRPGRCAAPSTRCGRGSPSRRWRGARRWC